MEAGVSNKAEAGRLSLTEQRDLSWNKKSGEMPKE